jgi:pyruvate formate-lyase activating enzyme-like uncharacterized protein
VGVEIPVFPDKEELIKKFAKSFSNEVGFFNLNELEIGETNEKYFSEKYSLNEDGYTVKGSINSAKRIAKEIKKSNPKIKIHICTAKTKKLGTNIVIVSKTTKFFLLE